MRSDQLVSIDVFDPIKRAAGEAGIEWERAGLKVVELTDDADLTVRIEERERLDAEDSRRVALKAVQEHGLGHSLAADLVGRSTAWVAQQVAEERDRDE